MYEEQNGEMVFNKEYMEDGFQLMRWFGHVEDESEDGVLILDDRWLAGDDEGNEYEVMNIFVDGCLVGRRLDENMEVEETYVDIYNGGK